MDTREILLVLGLVLLLALLSPAIFKQKASGFTAYIERARTTYGDFIHSFAGMYGIPPRRVIAMVIQESKVNAGAQGLAGERGLMQLKLVAVQQVNMVYGKSYRWADMYDPFINLQCGILYLKWNADMLRGDIDAATQAYNAGLSAYSLDNTKGAAYLEAVKVIERGIPLTV